MDVPFSTIDWLNRPPMVEDISNEEENNIDPEPQVRIDQVSDVICKNGPDLQGLIFVFFLRSGKTLKKLPNAFAKMD